MAPFILRSRRSQRDWHLMCSHYSTLLQNYAVTAKYVVVMFLFSRTNWKNGHFYITIIIILHLTKLSWHVLLYFKFQLPYCPVILVYSVDAFPVKGQHCLQESFYSGLLLSKRRLCRFSHNLWFLRICGKAMLIHYGYNSPSQRLLKRGLVYHLCSRLNNMSIIRIRTSPAWLPLVQQIAYQFNPHPLPHRRHPHHPPKPHCE